MNSVPTMQQTHDTAMHTMHESMQHDSDADAPCERCSEHETEDLGLISDSSPSDAISVSATVSAHIPLASVTELHTESVLRSYVVTTGPPPVPDIVKTIVLRT